VTGPDPSGSGIKTGYPTDPDDGRRPKIGRIRARTCLPLLRRLRHRSIQFTRMSAVVTITCQRLCADEPNMSGPRASVPFDPVRFADSMGRVAERSQKIVLEFLTRGPHSFPAGMADASAIGAAFLDLTTKMMTDPTAFAVATVDLWARYVTIWQQTGASGGAGAVPTDRRFRDQAWADNAIFDFIKQTYLISADSILSSVRSVKGLDQKTAHKVDFYTRQFVDAISPSNFIATNPEVLRTTIETGGENLLHGLSNLLDDLTRGNGRLAITMSDMNAFRLGDNLAATPGKVVARNELMELIQYDPATPEVRRRPLLIVPPWINKFYILDLGPEKSFIKWAVAQGHTVFVISWINPDARLGNKTFEDYMIEGLLLALSLIEQATGEREVNAIGYCLGGTLLASTLAYLSAKSDIRIKSATYLVTLVDFTDVGDIAVFIDEQQLSSLEKRMQERGYLDAHDMAASFNMLRANDLIWSFVVNNYLLGKEPLPFDLLYWNADATRMPAAMHSFYLRNMYQENRLIVPGGITLAGVPIDLRRVDTPTFILAALEDHIAPWRSTYVATQIYSGAVKFVLAASGHIAGVISPPGSKYGHWQNERLPERPQAWFDGATAHKGSWWPSWDQWISSLSGGNASPRAPGDGGLQVLESAPGSYVRVRASE
jgi:polyhydroxyalkanoate synthase subunit PhaC